jgi:hypothetical protein
VFFFAFSIGFDFLQPSAWPAKKRVLIIHNRHFARVVKLVDTADLKSAAFLNKGRTGSIPVPGTIYIEMTTSMDGAVFFLDKKLIQNQGVRLFTQAPKYHQYDDFEVLQIDRATCNGGSAVNDHFAHGRWQHTGRL